MQFQKDIQTSDFFKKPVIVTGAAGFIGFYVAKYLLESGASVVAIDNLNDYYDIALKETRLNILKSYEHFHFHKIDLIETQAVKDIFKQTAPDIVIHLAAQAGVRYSIDHPFAYVNSNLIGFMSLLEAVRDVRPKHTIYASSSSVYGHNEETPFRTDHRTDHPVSLYAATKKSNEMLAHSYAEMYGLPLTGLRFFTVYGPMGRPDMSYYKFTKAIIENKPIKIFNNGDMLRDFTYIDDITEGVIGMIFHPPSSEKAPHDILNIGHNQPEKLMNMIAFLEEIIGKTAQKEFLPMQTGDVYATYADIAPLTAKTSIKPQMSLFEGLKRFVTWYHENYE
ncbi:MAG: SDR family NAD(P)-dependent oxidoreductase [Pseudomonadota bacterium]